MRLFYSAFAAAMLSLFPAGMSAENYLVREDRVWEYQAAPGYSSGAVSISYKLYFEGDTVVDGKIYNILRTKDSTRYMWDGPGTPYVPEKIDDGLPFLLREEDGKVYVHAPIEGYGEYEYWGDGSPYYWSSADMEALLYDFNANVGDEMTVVGSWGEKLHGKVDSTFTVDVNGTPCKGYAFLPDDMAMPFQVIEGLGNISIGSIPYYVIDFPTRAIPSLKQELVRVTDLDGNVICEKSGGEWPWERPAQTDSLVREDRIWNYQKLVCNMDGKVLEKTSFGGFHFNGTEEIDGITYHRFLAGDDNIVALMRQEGDKVYLYLNDDKYPVHGDGEVVPSRDMLMYDFGAQAGMDYNSVGFDDGNGVCSCLVNITIADNFTVNVHDCDYQYQWLDVIQNPSNTNSYLVVGGVGPQRGRLDNPQWGLMSSAGTYIYWQLETMTDLEGNILFEYKDFELNNNPDGVDNIESDSGLSYNNGIVHTSAKSHVEVFNLSGKLVAEGLGSVSTAGLQPGVYVARAAGQSLKIVVK